MTASVQGSLHADMANFITLCAIAHHYLCVCAHMGFAKFVGHASYYCISTGSDRLIRMSEVGIQVW